MNLNLSLSIKSFHWAIFFILFSARTNGFVIYQSSWNTGNIGHLYFPTDATAVRVIFPQDANIIDVSIRIKLSK